MAVVTQYRPSERSERNIAWIEKYCLIPEGKHVGQPLRLTDQQRNFLHGIYDGQTRTAIISMARKNAKTALSAALDLLHIVGPEAKVNSQLFSAAQSRDQASILFSLAAKMIRMHGGLSEATLIRDSAKEILCPELGTKYKALSADASTAYGLSPVFVVHDELGQVRGPRSELYEALETASAAQESPLSIVISTQAPGDNDLLSVLIDNALKQADPAVKVFLFTADVDLDPFSEEAIRQANPHFDDFMNREEVFRQARAAKEMPSQEPSYRNLILNQRVERVAPFVAPSIWKRNGAEPIKFRGPVYLGLDLSSTTDLTAMVAVGWTGDEVSVLPTFWLPEAGLAEKAHADRQPYDQWAQAGLLNTSPGATVNYQFVAGHMRALFDEYDIAAVGFDRHAWKYFRPWLEEAGFDEDELERFHEVPQGYRMDQPLRRLEELMLNGVLRHGMHPVLTMCAQNAVAKLNATDQRMIVKNSSTRRIDGMVALAMAVSVMQEKNEDASAQLDDFLSDPVMVI